MSDGIRVFLVDDQSLVRAGLKLVIDSQSDMAVVGRRATAARRSRRWPSRPPTWC